MPLTLAEGTVDMAALSDTPLALPQPETPSDGSYAFLGWAGRYDTAGGKVWTTVPDPLTADFAASIRPGDTGERSIVLRAAWRLTEQSRYPWSLTLDDGINAVTYEAAVPMASGGDVYLCAYPQPTRDGYRFTGWYSDYDLTRPWDFNAPVTADMTLYAAWQPLPAAAPSAGPWAWLIVGASISALTVLALRRRS